MNVKDVAHCIQLASGIVMLTAGCILLHNKPGPIGAFLSVFGMVTYMSNILLIFI